MFWAFLALNEHISVLKNNKWLKSKEWRPLFITAWALRVCQCCVCLSEQEVWFRCRMRLVNQTLHYHKQCDDITRGGERGRGWLPRFPRCAGEKAFLASHRLESVSTSMEESHKTPQIHLSLPQNYLQEEQGRCYHLIRSLVNFFFFFYFESHFLTPSPQAELQSVRWPLTQLTDFNIRAATNDYFHYQLMWSIWF